MGGFTSTFEAAHETGEAVGGAAGAAWGFVASGGDMEKTREGYEAGKEWGGDIADTGSNAVIASRGDTPRN